MTTVKIRPVVEPTALYCRYENNYEPQPVYINLDLADGALYADYRATNDTPMRVWLGQVRAWKIPPLVADAANELLKDIAPLAQRILDGSSIEVNPRTGDRVGVLDDDAMAAEWEIYEIIENWHEDPTVSVVEEISVGEWYSGGDDPCDELGLTAETSDEDLPAIAAKIEKDIRTAAGAVVVVTGAEEWVRARRDEMRDELRNELMQVTADLGAQRARRDELVRRLYACGDSTRAIAKLIGTSHTQIRRIIG
ncbi:MAG: hypothetical protein DIU79_10680 [Actinobacteria bacterium]|nr:MAG: hypothetical protein DIU79_10680 [Actinomycetota bacterium]